MKPIRQPYEIYPRFLDYLDKENRDKVKEMHDLRYEVHFSQTEAMFDNGTNLSAYCQDYASGKRLAVHQRLNFELLNGYTINSLISQLYDAFCKEDQVKILKANRQRHVLMDEIYQQEDNYVKSRRKI